jgi:transcriptional regulator with XRE-family HTH domain
MPDIEAPPGTRLATLIKEARKRRGWTQEALVEESGVSRQTIMRYESGDAVYPRLPDLKAVCQVLGIDPRDALVALDFATRKELSLPPPPPPLDPVLARAQSLLSDPNIPDAPLDVLRRQLHTAIEYWYETYQASRPPVEPSAADRTKRGRRETGARPTGK